MLFNFFLFFFSSVLLISSLLVITVQNSVYSVIFLVVSFLAASGMLFLIECEFFAFLFIIVYVGAIAVLFLFVVMMLDVKAFKVNRNSFRYFPFGIFVAIILLWQILAVIKVQYQFFFMDSVIYNNYHDWYAKIDVLTEIEVLGQILYTHFVVQFLIAGLILTVSVLGSALLTVKLAEKKNHNQVLNKQLSRKQRNALYF